MRNLLALAFVALFLSACAAHVWTNTTVRDDYGQWNPSRPAYWQPGGRSLPGLTE